LEHILLKSNGYCKIGCYDSCLNFVKTEKNRWDRVQNCNSYIAPEGNQIGATYSYDYWCLGISIFKMLTNKFPFQNKLSMFEDLVPEIEDKNASIEAKNLVTNLLVKDPTERLVKKLTKNSKMIHFLTEYFFIK
jgi:serine/threonine protein kinase